MSIFKLDSITIYPFSRDQLQLINMLRHRNKHIHIELVAPTGFGYVNKDAGDVDRRSILGLTVGNDIDKALEKTDTFWAADGKYPDEIRRKALRFADSAIERGMNFICDMTLSAEEKNCYSEKCISKKVKFFYCNNEYKDIHSSLLLGTQDFYVPSIPVVFVAGLIPKSNEVDTVFYLVESLESKGYNVTSIVEKPVGIVAGAYSLPKAFFCSELDGVKKIQYVNNFIKYVIEQENPDILIVQVPGGILKYNNDFPNDFGLYAYMLSHAIKPDYTILCVPLDRVEHRYYDMLRAASMAKYDIHIDFIFISNLLIDLEESREMKKLCHAYCSHKFLESIISDSFADRDDIDSFFSEYERQKMLKHILTTL